MNTSMFYVHLCACVFVCMCITHNSYSFISVFFFFGKMFWLSWHSFCSVCFLSFLVGFSKTAMNNKPIQVKRANVLHSYNPINTTRINVCNKLTDTPKYKRHLLVVGWISWIIHEHTQTHLYINIQCNLCDLHLHLNKV